MINFSLGKEYFIFLGMPDRADQKNKYFTKEVMD